MTLLQKLFCHHPTATDKDKGLAWGVLFWSTIAHMLHCGFLAGVYGSLTIQHQHKFNITLTESGLIGSVNNFFVLCFAPVASVMIVKLSTRVVEMFGGVCLLVGIGGSAFATEAWHGYLLVGVIAGIGFSSSYMASSSILVHHFDRYKYLAFSTVTMGVFVGIVVWPMVTQTLFDSFGYSTSMGILGLIMCLHIVCGAFFTEERKDGQSCWKKAGCCQELSHDGEESRCDSEQKIGCENKGLDASQDSLNTKSNSPSGEEIHKISDDGISNDSGGESSSDSRDFELKEKKPQHLLKDMKKLLRSWKVWCILLNFGLWNFNVTSFLVFVNDYMVMYVGLEEAEAALGITILGAANIVGNLATIFASRYDFNRLALYMSMSAIFGICTIISPFTNSMAMYYVVTAVWGMSQGAHLATVLSVCYDICGEELLTILFGLALCAEGITGVTTSSLCGYLQSEVHPVAGLCLSGASGIASSLVLMPLLVAKIYNKRNAEKVTLKAMVIAGNKGLQTEVIEKVSKAADAEYPEIQLQVPKRDSGAKHQITA